MKRQFFDPSIEVRCWVDDGHPPNAGYSSCGWRRERVLQSVEKRVRELRERLALHEQWLSIMRDTARKEDPDA